MSETEALNWIEQNIMASKIYGSPSRLATLTLFIIWYFWRAGLHVARRTYHYSSKTGRKLFTHKATGLFSSRRGLHHQLHSVIPSLNNSWKLIKFIEKQLLRHFGIKGTAQLKNASQKLFRMASRIDSIGDIDVLKHGLKRLTGVTTNALSHLSKIGHRRERHDRHRIERRPHFKSIPRGLALKEHKFRERPTIEKHMSIDHHSIRRPSVSWGELIQSNDTQHNHVLKQFNSRMSLYKKVPLKSISRLWGKFNQMELPEWMRVPAFNLYIWMFGCSLDDAAVQDLKTYRNLSEFFRRKLKPGIRPVDGAHILTSPADGRILNCGVVEDGALEQVKGVTYSLLGFLGPFSSLLNPDNPTPSSLSETDSLNHLLSNPNNKLYHCIIYLAPGDYHKFHSPANWNVYARRHFPGELFSVNPGVARWLQGLFNFNERAVYSGKWTHGFFSMTAVGATNVGSINVKFDQELTTNTGTEFPSGSYYDRCFSTDKRRSIPLSKGELVGDFNLGSTIVLLFEAPKDFHFNVKPGQRLKYGQGIGGCERQLVNHGIKINRPVPVTTSCC
jgi:phosphatidylserine decarboxylase